MSNSGSLGPSRDADAGKPPLALIAGPTASGKSDLAVGLALRLRERGQQAAIINADSAQVYRDLSILSARPRPDEMRGIEHRLFGTWDGAQACSAADWARAARREIEECHATGVLPILVGGTGLYLRTLLDGIAPIPAIDPAVRESVRAIPVDAAYAALLEEDPERAALLAPADTTRVARALEVVRSTGRALGYWQERREGGIGDEVTLSAVVLLPERDRLYERCDERFAVMLENGAVEEVRVLLERELDPDLPVMRAIGVPELTSYLGGALSLEQAIERGTQATRNYAKRQFTWLRHQLPASWPRLDPSNFNFDDLFVILFPLLA